MNTIAVLYRRFVPSRLGILGLLLSLLLAASGVQAQESFVVQDFRVEGLQRIAEGTVYNYLPINIGETITPQRSSEALRALFNTGFFDDVQLFREGSTLVISVRERPTILEFTLVGNQQINEEVLMQALSGVGLRPGRAFDRSILNDVTQFLTEQYYNMGRYGVIVNPQVEELPDNQVRIAIEILEGERARIRQINIVGNETFSDRELLAQFQLGTTSWSSWFRQNDRYAQELLQGDLESLRSYYMDRGFADFEIESVQVTISPDLRDIFITVNVDEGARYTISDVRLIGRLPVDEDELLSLMQIQAGQTFSLRLLSQSAEAIAMRLGEDGYAFADIQPQPELDRDNRTVSVAIFVEPYNRVYVRRINFEGTDRVNDEVFRREMRQLEGGYLSNSLVLRSLQRLRQLPYLDSVGVTVEPVPGSPDQVDLNFSVAYGLPGELEFGVGWSTSESFVVQGRFTHTNFLGRGQHLSGEIDTSRFSTIYSLSHTNPYTSIDGVSRTVSLSFQDRGQLNALTSDFSTRILSGSLTYAYPISEFQNIRVGATVQNSRLMTGPSSSSQARDWVTWNGNYFERDFSDYTAYGTRFNTYELNVGWVFDSRDRNLFATSGARHQLNLSYAFPPSDVEYWTASYLGTQYLNLPGPFTLRLNANLFYGSELRAATSLPPSMQRFAGGFGTVRGYRERSLGPWDSLGNPYGGNILVAGQVELLLPLPEGWQDRASLSLFYDIGNVFSDESVRFYDLEGNRTTHPFSFSELRQSVGIGVEWLLAPLGIFRISYAVPLNPFPGDAQRPADRTDRLQFTIGSAF